MGHPDADGTGRAHRAERGCRPRGRNVPGLFRGNRLASLAAAEARRSDGGTARCRGDRHHLGILARAVPALGHPAHRRCVAGTASRNGPAVRHHGDGPGHRLAVASHRKRVARLHRARRAEQLGAVRLQVHEGYRRDLTSKKRSQQICKLRSWESSRCLRWG